MVLPTPPQPPLLTASCPPAGCVRFWRACQLLPFFYLGLAWLANQYLFPAFGTPAGLYPLARLQFRVLLLSFVGLAATAQMVLIVLRRADNARLAALPDGDPELPHVHWHRTLRLVACADAVAGLGLILFLLQGNWDAFIGFCLAGYILYAQAHPLRYLPRREN